MGEVKIILILTLAFSSTLGAEDPEKRPTRTIARFLGLESPRPQQPPQQQQQQQHQQQVFSNIPFVYNVKYYDRAGENPEVQVEQAQAPQQQVVQQPQQQVGVQDRFMPSTRVFLNLYTGQQTPVYYDSKGQLYVPCPAYDHQVQTGVPKQVGVHVPAQKNVVGPQPQPVVYNNPVVPPQAEFVYYGGVPPQHVHQQQQQQQQQHKQIPQQRPPGVGVGPPVVPYVSQVPVPVVPEVLYYANPPQQQQQQQQKVVGYPPSSTVVTYNPYEVPYAYVPTPYGYPGVVNPGHVGHVVYQNGQGGYVNPFVYVKPAQVTVPPGQPVPVHAHVHTHPQGPVPTQQTDQVSVVVEKKNVSEKTEGQ